ncbi:MAG: YceI family protein [Chloroflexota bacterium]
MKMRNVIIALVVVVLAVAGGVFAFLTITAGDGEASQDISEVAGQIEEAGEGTLLRIDGTQSEARFELDEDLRGERITVVGTTDQVGGDIVINFADPALSEVGTITINARTITTDNNFRNQALRGQILKSAQDQYEFVTFTPTELTGLPEEITTGETYTFQIIGDLNILDVTESVTFDAEVTIVSETEITGTASTSVLWADYGISIPNVPGVANITDDVALIIDFVAVPPAEGEMEAEATEEAGE